MIPVNMSDFTNDSQNGSCSVLRISAAGEASLIRRAGPARLVERIAGFWIFASVACLFVASLAHSQEANEKPNRFENEIRAFEARDKLSPPPKNAVLFVGSSSFRLWQSLEQDFPGIAVINRGFGGAEFGDVIHFADRIVLPYEPRIVIVYAGSLDLHGEGGSPERVLEAFRRFRQKVHDKLPETRVCFLSMKPSLAKWDTIELDRKANRLVAEYAAKTPNVGYIDIWTPMLAEGSPPPRAYFRDDRNHPSAEGYKVWTRAIRAYLEDGSERESTKKK